jgi:hypothetical protein
MIKTQKGPRQLLPCLIYRTDKLKSPFQVYHIFPKGGAMSLFQEQWQSESKLRFTLRNFSLNTGLREKRSL